MHGDPIEGQVLLLAGAKASVAPERVPGLVDQVQAALAPQREDYRQRYELAYEADDHAAFFVEDGHWDDLGEGIGMGRREIDAVRRAHHEQLLREGRRRDRGEEFESALEIRECVLIGREPAE